MSQSCPLPLSPSETHGAHCGRLHCAVCTAHLANPQQRYCSARCRTRARTLRKALVYCPQCRAPLWLSKSLARQLHSGGSAPACAGRL